MPARTPDPREIVVRFEGLTRRYREGGRERTVLAGASAEIRRGEFVALLGPSGSGKSTLLNLLSGIDQPDEGWVDVAGVRLTALDERARTIFRRQHIGFVFQFFNLLPTLTVLENLLLPLELKGRVGGGDEAGAMALLRRVGLADRAGAFPDRLSGGEQQRVALARALVHEPALVLADEPTGNLDPETGERVGELLDALVREQGRTLLVVTHAPALAARADRVFGIERGRLVERAVAGEGEGAVTGEGAARGEGAVGCDGGDAADGAGAGPIERLPS